MLWMALLLGCALPEPVPPPEEAPVKAYRVYVGTYTNRGKSQGIYLLELDPESGKLTPRGLAAESMNPSFLAIHPSRKFLYAVDEIDTFDGKKAGAVSAFAIDPESGKLTRLNRKTSGGTGPCFVTIDKAGKNALVANYGGGSVEVLPIEADGRLAEPSAFIQHKGSSRTARQMGPHAHSINLDAAGKFAVAADLGLDKLLVYRFDPAAGSLTPADPPFASLASGSGPRHFTFHPDGRHAYVINEIAQTVTAFDYLPAQGAFKEIQSISTLPGGITVPGNSTAEVQVHPSGAFLYGSNRGHDSIAIFSIDPSTGRLTAIGDQSTGGKTPRNFGIDPSGKFLLAANQGSDSVIVFRIDPQTGLLRPTGQSAEVPMPVCIKMIPMAK